MPRSNKSPVLCAIAAGALALGARIVVRLGGGQDRHRLCHACAGQSVHPADRRRRAGGGRDLGATLETAAQSGGAPEGQFKLVQNFANSGAQGIATSVPGESMAKGLNEIIASGVPIVQFNLLSTAVKAPYVGEKSTESGRILGKMIVEKLGGASAKGTVILGNCFPGFPVLENRAKGVEESLKVAKDLKVLGPYRRESQRSRQL